jgi:hypothetical protein
VLLLFSGGFSRLFIIGGEREEVVCGAAVQGQTTLMLIISQSAMASHCDDESLACMENTEQNKNKTTTMTLRCQHVDSHERRRRRKKRSSLMATPSPLVTRNFFFYYHIPPPLITSAMGDRSNAIRPI